MSAVGWRPKKEGDDSGRPEGACSRPTRLGQHRHRPRPALGDPIDGRLAVHLRGHGAFGANRRRRPRRRTHPVPHKLVVCAHRRDGNGIQLLSTTELAAPTGVTSASSVLEPPRADRPSSGLTRCRHGTRILQIRTSPDLVYLGAVAPEEGMDSHPSRRSDGSGTRTGGTHPTGSRSRRTPSEGPTLCTSACRSGSLSNEDHLASKRAGRLGSETIGGVGCITPGWFTAMGTSFGTYRWRGSQPVRNCSIGVGLDCSTAGLHSAGPLSGGTLPDGR